MAQIRGYLADNAIRQHSSLVVVSPQPPAKLTGWDQATWLTDADGAVARLFGVAGNERAPLLAELIGYRPHSAYPTTLISNASGRILYAQQTENELDRPSNDAVLAVLQAMQADTIEPAI